MSGARFTCQTCESLRGSVACQECGQRRCEDHLLLSVEVGEVGHTYTQTHMVPGPVIGFAPTGQPIHSPPFVPVHVPVTVQVPVLMATTHNGLSSNYPYPSGPSPRVIEAEVESWTKPVRTCVWCRERAAASAGEAAKEIDAREAREEAERAALKVRRRRQAEADLERTSREQHLIRLRKARETHGPEEPIERAIAADKAKLAKKIEESVGGFSDDALFRLSLLLIGAAAFGGWTLGMRVSGVDTSAGEDSFLPLIFAGCGAVLAVALVLALSAMGKASKQKRARDIASLRESISVAESKIGCGDADCRRCKTAEALAIRQQ
ncbi:hypothetical protein [Miltoncostaea oceani]|uniref:hypothetical protein n=1 Tax=Miltoncostaea oceani TaxID=2843216 RepID=UPI001C3CE752|nr:hypothetical protein [Miltoncostaea oceani]